LASSAAIATAQHASLGPKDWLGLSHEAEQEIRTSQGDEELRRQLSADRSINEIALRLKRSPLAVRTCMKKLGIREPGCRRRADFLRAALIGVADGAHLSALIALQIRRPASMLPALTEENVSEPHSPPK